MDSGGPVVVEIALQVSVDNLIPLRFGHFPDDAVPVDTGVADQNMQAAPFVHNLFDHILRILETDDIGLNCQPLASDCFYLPDNLFGFGIMFAVVDGNIGPFFGQSHRNRRPDSQTGTGNNRIFPFEVHLLLHLRYVFSLNLKRISRKFSINDFIEN